METIITWADGPNVNAHRQAQIKAVLAKGGKLPDAKCGDGSSFAMPTMPRITTRSHRPSKPPTLSLTCERSERIVGKFIAGCTVLSTDGYSAVVSGHASIAWMPLSLDVVAWEDAYAPVHAACKPELFVEWSWENGRTYWRRDFGANTDVMSVGAWVTSPNGQPCKVRVSTKLAWQWRGADAWAVAGSSERPGESQYLLLRFKAGVVLIQGAQK